MTKRPDEINKPLPREMALWYRAREKSRLSREKEREDKALKDLIQRLWKIMHSGSLQQKIDAMLYAQTLDYHYLSQDGKARGNIAGNIESLTTGLKHYEICRDHPEQYRRFAEGYRKQERVAPKRGVPNDEMHKALRSHMKHIESRLSPMLPPLENTFVEAQRDLAAAVRKEYIALQESVLEMGESNN